MNDLFTLYRYLVNNSGNNPYTPALAAMEQVLDQVEFLEGEGRHIREEGGIKWDQADHITDMIVDQHKTALCAKAGSSLEALKDFASTHISLGDIDTFIEALQAQKLNEQAALELEEDLGDLDDHPF